MTIYLGHKVEAKRTKAGFVAVIDGKRDREIEPAKYKGVIYRRVKARYRIKWLWAALQPEAKKAKRIRKDS